MLHGAVQEDQLGVPGHGGDVGGFRRRANRGKEGLGVGAAGLLDEIVEVSSEDGPKPTFGNQICERNVAVARPGRRSDSLHEELHPCLARRQQMRHQGRVLMLRRCLGVVPVERLQPGQPVASVDSLIVFAPPLVPKIGPASDHLGEARGRWYSGLDRSTRSEQQDWPGCRLVQQLCLDSVERCHLAFGSPVERLRTSMPEGCDG